MDSDIGKCPNCAESTKEGAILCRFCKLGFSGNHFFQCPYCFEMIRMKANFCRFCQNSLNKGSRESIVFNHKFDPGYNDSLMFRQSTDIFYKTACEFESEFDNFIENLSNECKNESEKEKINEFINSLPVTLTSKEKDLLEKGIFDEAFGFGPLESLISNREVLSIFVEDPESVHARRLDGFFWSEVRFRSEQHLRKIVNRNLARVGIILSKGNPVVSVKLQNELWAIAALSCDLEEVHLVLHKPNT